MELSPLRRPLATARGLRRRAGRTVRRLRDRALLAPPDERGLLRFLGGRFGTIEEAIAAARATPPPLLAAGLGKEEAARFFASHPDRRARLVAAADRILRHRFDLLGSGPVDLGVALPWHTDFRVGHVWDHAAWFEDLRARIESEFGRGRDVKVPWELSRLQHAPLLGQAAWLSSDPAYWREFRDEVEDWIAANPLGRGVNWTCTMDVALRAISWTWGYAWFRDEILADREFVSRFWRALVAHGRFVRDHLENGGGPIGNHYFADLLGLLLLGVLLRGAPEADAWRIFATAEIDRENEAQTLPDGVDYEASIAYHRLMTEMAITALLLIERSGGAAPGLRVRVRRMAEYIAHYTKPDGLAPQIGDNDDGRAQVLGEHDADRRDHRSVLAIAACIFDDPALLRLAGDRIEEAFWLFGAETLDGLESRGRGARVIATGAAFAHGGVAILRHGDLYAALDAGPVGLGGHGGHAHNDTLSVEIQAGGRDLIVDPGTGGYTADLVLRDRFRSTAAHNTVRIDGLEINPLPGVPFQLPGVDRPAIVRATFRRNFDLVEAMHHGYERLRDPVRHRRVVLLNPVTRRFVIEDRVEGREEHLLEWFFHLAPDVEVAFAAGAAVDAGAPRLDGRAGRVGFTFEGTMLPPGARLRLEPDLVSPGYGRVVPSTTLICTWEGRLPVVARFVLTVAWPEEPAATPDHAG
jgi:uncharacterized heparinase superfamily protein